MAKMAFLTVNNFFCAFSKIPTKRTFVRLLFLKLNQSQNTETIFFGWGFFKHQKRTFSGVQNGTFKKSNFKFLFLPLFFNVQYKDLHANFHKKILIFGPTGIFFNENFDLCAPARARSN